MSSANFLALQSELAALRSYLRTAYSVRSVLSLVQKQSEPSILDHMLTEAASIAPGTVPWRIMDHVLVVGRLYSVYEAFCEDALAEWIEFLSINYDFAKLPERTVSSYRLGFTAILSMLPSPRFPLLDAQTLVSNYNAALSGVKGYQLDPECLTYHKNNLRWSELCDLLAKCGLDNFSTWSSRSPIVIEYFAGDADRLVDQLSSRLDELVKYRNDSSHGLIEVDEILGQDVLESLIQFVDVLCTTIQDYLDGKRCEKLHELGVTQDIGDVTELFTKAQAIVLRSSGGSIRVGQKVAIGAARGFLVSEVQSIQVHGAEHSHVNAQPGDEIGLRLSKLPRVNAKLYALPD